NCHCQTGRSAGWTAESLRLRTAIPICADGAAASPSRCRVCATVFRIRRHERTPPESKLLISTLFFRWPIGGAPVANSTCRTQMQNLVMSEWSLNPPSDAGARVVDDLLFRFLVDLEVQKAQRLRYCFSLMCLTFEAPAETRESSVSSFAEIATRYIRATDVMAPWAPASLAVLLPRPHRLPPRRTPGWGAGACRSR